MSKWTETTRKIFDDETFENFHYEVIDEDGLVKLKYIEVDKPNKGSEFNINVESAKEVAAAIIACAEEIEKRN